jgi:hypothetical protein
VIIGAIFSAFFNIGKKQSVKKKERKGTSLFKENAIDNGAAAGGLFWLVRRRELIKNADDEFVHEVQGLGL